MGLLKERSVFQKFSTLGCIRLYAFQTSVRRRKACRRLTGHVFKAI